MSHNILTIIWWKNHNVSGSWIDEIFSASRSWNDEKPLCRNLEFRPTIHSLTDAMWRNVIGHENQSQHCPDGFPRRTDYHPHTVSWHRRHRHPPSAPNFRGGNCREKKYFSTTIHYAVIYLNNVILIVIVQQCNLADQATDFVVD